MGTLSRQLVVGALAAFGFACGTQHAFAQSNPATPGQLASRVRTANPIIRALMHDASERSETFRRLVASIERTDGLVYLNVGTCGRIRACLLHQVTVAGPSRVLNIIVDVRRHDLALAAAIGHELQHALEVLGDARIRTDIDIFAYYTLHGLEVRGVIETRAAIATGEAVGDEVHRSTGPAPAS
jgi:hypothetical protein